MSTTRVGVVVGVDGSTASDQALDWAAAEAVRRRTGLTVLTTFETATVPGGDSFGIGPGVLQDEAQDVIGWALRRLAGARNRRPGSVPEADDVEHEVIRGSAAGALVERSAASQLVVVGRRGLHALDRMFLGSVSAAVSAMARGPVAVVPVDQVAGESACPADAVGPVWRVVASVDFDDHMGRVLDLAFEEALHAAAPLVVVHALGQDFIAGPYAAQSAWVHRYRDEKVASLTEELTRWGEKYPTVSWSIEMDHGSPVDAVIRRIGRHDVLLVGGRRHSPMVGRVLRSVADRLVRQAECPVIVAHDER